MAKFVLSPLFLVLVCVAAIKGASAACSSTNAVPFTTQLTAANVAVSCTAAATATVTFTIPATVTNIVQFGIVYGSTCVKLSVPADRKVVFSNIPCGTSVTAWGERQNNGSFQGTGAPICLGGVNNNNAAGCRIGKLADNLVISCATPTNAGEVCTLNGAATLPCDAPDAWAADCTCPDSLTASGTLCLAKSAEPCDDDDYCTGDSKNCEDSVLPSGTPCGDAVDLCDEVDVCLGDGNKSCPDILKEAGTECRAAASPCDAAEFCTGLVKTCPADFCQAGGAPEGPACPARRRLF